MTPSPTVQLPKQTHDDISEATRAFLNAPPQLLIDGEMVDPARAPRWM